jgi:hypothetical protein
VATEATRLASEACDAIKVSRESIRAALREMGAASDISEASGPVRSQPMLSERVDGEVGASGEEAGGPGPHMAAAPPSPRVGSGAPARRD